MSPVESERLIGKEYAFDHYKIGEMDTSGREIEQIAYYEYNTYIIYFVKGDYLKAYFVNGYGVKMNIGKDIQFLVGKIRSMNIKNEKENAFVRRSLASAYYNAVNGYSDVAMGELRNLRNKIVYRCYSKWLAAYLVCNVALVMLYAWIMFFVSDELVKDIASCITSSCVGSFLIYSKEENEHMVQHYLPTVDALITFFASCISGFLMYCILKSNLILGAFNESRYGMIMLCFIAGYNGDVPLKLLKSLTGRVMPTDKKE